VKCKIKEADWMPKKLTPSYISLCRLNVLRQINDLSHLVKNLEAAKLPLGIRQRERGNIPRSTRPFDFILHNGPNKMQ
jgi:hypothetical protein